MMEAGMPHPRGVVFLTQPASTDVTCLTFNHVSDQHRVVVSFEDKAYDIRVINHHAMKFILRRK
jgi:hypothetical protein